MYLGIYRSKLVNILGCHLCDAFCMAVKFPPPVLLLVHYISPKYSDLHCHGFENKYGLQVVWRRSELSIPQMRESQIVVAAVEGVCGALEWSNN